MWAFFYDRPTPGDMKFFKKARKNAHLMALFILMDEHPTSMAEQLQTLADNKGPNVRAEYLSRLYNMPLPPPPPLPLFYRALRLSCGLKTY